MMLLNLSQMLLRLSFAPEGLAAVVIVATDRRAAQPRAVSRARAVLEERLTDEWLITILAAVFSIAAYIWFSRNGMNLGYGDALSRMVIARRVVVGRVTGLGQLGTTWLPLHTMLMLPFVWNDTLFKSGLAGSIPSMIAYVISSVTLFRLINDLFGARWTAWTGALIFMLNPSVIYIQTTAMSESALLATAIVAMFYMLRWAKSYYALDLVKAAVAVAASAGIRYDGWALAVAFTCVVAYVGWKRQGWRGVESNLIVYSMVAFSSCVAWFIYNLVIFHDPVLFLFFGNAKHSVIKYVGYHRPWLSLEMFLYAAGATMGWAMAALSILGLALFVARHRTHVRSLPVYAALVPIPYHWLIFFVGVDAIFLPELGLGPNWNVRFGLMLMPACAIFVAYLAHRFRYLNVLVLGMALALCIANFTVSIPMSQREPMHNVIDSTTYDFQQRLAAEWLVAHYHGGNVLLSNQPDAPMMFYMLRGIPDGEFIADTPTDLFQRALEHPEKSATWIVLDKSGAPPGPVYAALSTRHDWQQHFVLRRRFGNTSIYERVDDTQSALPSAVASVAPSTSVALSGQVAWRRTDAQTIS